MDAMEMKIYLCWNRTLARPTHSLVSTPTVLKNQLQLPPTPVSLQVLHLAYCRYFLPVRLGEERGKHHPVKIQGNSYSSDIAESEYDNQIAVSPTNIKENELIPKTMFIVNKDYNGFELQYTVSMNNVSLYMVL